MEETRARRCCPRAAPHLRLLLLPVLLLLLVVAPHSGRAALDPASRGDGGAAGSSGGPGSCYDARGRAQLCRPEFVNAAFGATVEASDTCGIPVEEEYCAQTGAVASSSSASSSASATACHRCSAADPAMSHGAELLTDADGDGSWWQSRSMEHGVQHPASVNLTLRLGKAFQITYVRLRFHTSRPESFAIYKRTSPASPWQPYQFYSGTCERTFGLPSRGFLRAGDDERAALCSDEFSDISPLTGGNVAFSTLEGRPGALAFDGNEKLQEWVTATDVRVSLRRLNTFGDEVFGDPKVLRSYYYAVSDLAVGGRCKCHGHASECGRGSDGRLVCRCQHNTTGHDCERCLPSHNSRPWAQGSSDDAHECLPCACNGHSNVCHYDRSLYQTTGNGGHCTGCRDNTAGPFCDRCRDNFYRQHGSGPCLPCNCDPVGSLSGQCSTTGQCACKAGVGGQRCDRCQPGHHSLSHNGCRPCACDPAGSTHDCQDGGQCVCKPNVEGDNCNRCRPGHFHLDARNPSGCSACFCFGHAASCSGAQGYAAHTVASSFHAGRDGWKAQRSDGAEVPVQWSGSSQEVTVTSADPLPIYFVAPNAFLGNQLLSYGQNLSFAFSMDRRDVRLSAEDVVLEGSGLRVSVPLIAQNNRYPTDGQQTYTYVLHENPAYPWTPQIPANEFRKLLSNLTAIKLRGTYSDKSTGRLGEVRLVTARPGYGAAAAGWVEQCSCPPGYRGLSCEACAPGHRRDPPGGGPLATCVPCSCHGHSGSCHPETGACECQHNTAGRRCEQCAAGFYGDATRGRADDCRACPCPQGSTCALVSGEVTCTRCPQGLTGKRCELCSDGYFGDTVGAEGAAVRPCRQCECNGNVDPNAVGNCDRRTGECLKCTRNTAGFFCDRCRDGHYGNALAPGDGDKCRPCACSRWGTLGNPGGCNVVTGQCECRPHVTGRDCGQCLPGYYVSPDGNGCERCNCDPVGSSTGGCDPVTGQCDCHPGTSGRCCDRCEGSHFGFSLEGCKPCDCDTSGSKSMQCDQADGSCPCREGVTGARCDQCRENYHYNRTNPGCQECPPCYRLVRDKAQDLRERLRELEQAFERIASDPGTGTDRHFEMKLQQAASAVEQLLRDAQHTQMSDQGLQSQLDELERTLASQKGRLQKMGDTVGETDGVAARAGRRAGDTQRMLERAQHELERAKAAIASVNIDGKNVTGPNNFTVLAEEARRLADSHKQAADDIERTANLANDTSTAAYNLLRKTLAEENDMGGQISELTRRVGAAKTQGMQLEALADAVHKEAKAAGDKALQIYANASTSVPNVDIDALQAGADRVKGRAAELDGKVSEQQGQFRELQDDLRPRVDEAKRLMQRGNTEQQVLDQLLARANAAFNSAKEAEGKGKATLKEATDTLNILRDFDKRVSDNKTAAEEALRRVPAVQAQIESANAKTRQAEEALGNAANDARDARAMAQDAEEIARRAQERAGGLKTEVENAYGDAAGLAEGAAGLLAGLAGAEAELARKQQDAARDMDLANMAAEAAQEAEDKARRAKSSVSGALEQIEQLLRDLGSLEDVDLGRLQDLERKYAEAERALAGGGELEPRLKRLEDAVASQSAALQGYDASVEQALADIRNLEEIRDALPQGCFNAGEIERP
ncbi:laminin subunit gamma-1-like isoform X1 [Lethenteron reissneri]|uniref:laminin subunit gamma-1-like isoform X1 n=1 Tax=Lethenteron reissneri TaxID=7753 RepID=UPI002AB784B1|nr:laminin subunit gamma-1-like isoform X1 [Lethenteron reissneri]